MEEGADNTVKQSTDVPAIQNLRESISWNIYILRLEGVVFAAERESTQSPPRGATEAVLRCLEEL